MISSLYSPLLIITIPPQGGSVCLPPPSFGTPLLINDGKEAFAMDVGNQFLISYSSFADPHDGIGNISNDGIVWNPAANNTDPPSHFLLISKDFPADCVFYPVFNLYANSFAMAWLETNPVGRINLKYTDIPTGNSGGNNGNPPPPVNPGVNQQTIYIYPDIMNVEQGVKSENIPMSDIQIVDIQNNTFTLDAFMRHALPRGYEMTMPDKIKAVRFQQSFSEPNINVQGLLTTAPTQNGAVQPLTGIGITIYYGRTNRVAARVTTDTKGLFSLKIKPGDYTFEVEVTTASISYSQRFV